MKHLSIYRNVLVMCLAGVGLMAGFHHTKYASRVMAAAVMHDDAISGEWDVKLTVHTTSVPAKFVLKLDGDKISGTANSEHTGPGTIKGSLDHNKLSMTMDFASHESILVTGIFKDGKLSGEFKTEGNTGKWEAVKK